MRIWQAIHTKLVGTSTITALVGENIYHGTRPAKDTGNYSINYFEVSGTGIVLDTQGLVENPLYQISCRAKTAGNAQELAYIVRTTLQNMRESVGGFDVNLTNFLPGGGVIEEEDGAWYHVPLTVRFVFFDAENA